jgi:hypothetical protein
MLVHFSPFVWLGPPLSDQTDHLVSLIDEELRGRYFFVGDEGQGRKVFLS